MAKRQALRDDPSKHVYYEVPTVFSRADLATQSDLFAHRAALFFTPTANLPARFVGEGPLQVRLPFPPPTIYEFWEIPGLRSPRLWVELLQRATRKLRWRPTPRSRVEIVCFDAHRWGPNRIGHKALVDALKRVTTGRRDGRLLHYFGAIEDDGPGVLEGSGEVRENLIDDPADAHCIVRIDPV
jgi:hypothetical protein